MEEKVEFVQKPSEGQPWDVVIVGSGPAGLTAAIYTTRGAASTLVLAGEKWGGQLMLTTEVDNYPGFPKGIQGPDLMMNMRKQSERFGAEIVEKNVSGVNFSKSPFELTADDTKYFSKSVIIATGSDTRWLGIPGEEKLRGRGVSSCAPCDAPFFKDKKVVVIGGGDSAMEEALVLVKYATEVIILHRREEFRASKAMQKKVFDDPKIKVIWNVDVKEFVGRRPEGAFTEPKGSQNRGSGPEGDTKLEKIKVFNSKEEKDSEIIVDGAFVAIGHVPSTNAFKDSVELDKKGYVVVHNGSKTNVEGVFVSGDVHDYHYKQAITAAGFGCQAAMDALRFLDKL